MRGKGVGQNRESQSPRRPTPFDLTIAFSARIYSIPLVSQPLPCYTPPMAQILGFDIVIRDQEVSSAFDLPFSGFCRPEEHLIELTVPQGTDPVLILYALFHEAAHVRQYRAGFPYEDNRLTCEESASKYAARRVFDLGVWPTRLAAAVWGEEEALGCTTEEIVAAFTRPSITLP